MSDDAQEWRWVGEDGVEKTVTEQELIAELSSESLPNYTLVWKKGWLEWLPAMQVSELGWALPPGKADSPVKAREKASAVTPPAPPLYRYPVIKRRAASPRGDAPSPPRPAAGAPRPTPQKPVSPSPPAIAAEPPTVALPVVAVTAKSEEATEPKPEPAPTAPEAKSKPLESRPFEEVEIDSIEASNPHASDATGDAIPEDDDTEEAVLVDERPGFSPFDGARAYAEEDNDDTRIIPSKPPPALYVGPHLPPTSERPPPSYDEDLPRFPPPPPPPADLYAGLSRAKEGPEKRSPILYVAAALGGGVVVLAIVFLTRGKNESKVPAPEPALSRTPAAREEAHHAPPAAPRADTRSDLKPCTVVTPALRIADWAEPGVAPSFAAIPGSQRVVVGYGQSETYAVGITIDPRTLDRDQVFREFRHQKLVSVVPTIDNGQIHFQVVRSGHALSKARAIDAATPFFIGATSAAIATVVGKGDPEPVWPLPDADESTVPRVATIPGMGHAVTFRRGGKTGKVAVGWLDPAGKRKTDLVEVQSEGDFAGNPSIAANDDGILVAFASRSGSDPNWSVALARASSGELPKTAVRFQLPGGGPGGSAISPSVATLSGGRWLLQWTEGSSGTRVVRAEVLAQDLTPLSAPVSLSPDGANAGQGAAWAVKDLGAVLFYVQNDKKSHELWGTAVECPR